MSEHESDLTIPDVGGQDITDRLFGTEEQRLQFSEYVDSALNELEIPETELCDRFAATLPAVRRWRQGRSSPVDFLQREVIQYLSQKRLEREVGRSSIDACIGDASDPFDEL